MTLKSILEISLKRPFYCTDFKELPYMSVLFIDSKINMVVHFILLLSKGAFAVNNNIII